MEGPNEKELSLPPGFRFHPTDEELVRHYLIRKVFNCVLSSSAVLENDNVFKSDPWDLPGGQNEEEMYFFTAREVKSGNRATMKATGKNKKIAIPKEKLLVGTRKTLVFYQGKPGFKTEWVMHEYRIILAPTPSPTISPSVGLTPMFQENWVLCKIFRRKKKNGDVISSSLKPAFRDFFAKERSDLSLAPASSSTNVVIASP